jgi:hypothetical protein
MQVNYIQQTVSVFRGLMLPEQGCELAGYSALIDLYDLRVPLPHKLAAISQRHRKYATGKWQIYTPRHKPGGTLQAHLIFALKYEGVDLAVLNALFAKINPEELASWVRAEPFSNYSRRVWFFYEWLTDKKLMLEDAKTGNFVNALDPRQQYVVKGHVSARHRVNNNLTGVKDFCPLIYRTKKLDEWILLNLDEKVKQRTGLIHKDILARAAAFLLLKDSKASFEIEGERPDKGRAERWGRAIGQAGLSPLSIQEILRLQTIVIADQRFIHMGLRSEGGFIGVHARGSGTPLPDHISAKWQDLTQLMDGLINAYSILKESKLNPVLIAAMIAFGFVFIHPLADGNGRIHRYLIHHVLAESGFSPKGITFPISAVILQHIEDYRIVLESYSRPRLEFIEWLPTERGNVEVLNETIDLYRYFDATGVAEFLYKCVSDTIDTVLPEEISYLERYDKMKTAITVRFDMPDYLIDLLIMFLQQNEGKLSKRAMSKEFSMLSHDECRELEKLYEKIFKAN